MTDTSGRRANWAERPELPADQVERIIREKIAVPVRIGAIALDRHPNSIYKDIKAGLIPTVGMGRGLKIPSGFLLEKLGLPLAMQSATPTAETP